MPRKVEELSASGIKSYAECEKQYWYKYLSEIDAVEQEEPEHFKVGNTVHDTLEKVLKDDELVIADEEELFQTLMRVKDTLEYDYEDEEKVVTCFETASRWISSFVSDVKHVEEKWTMDKDGIEFRGLSDLVADIEQGDEVYEDTIVDWKTGKENDEWKERIQGGMYAEMHKDIYGTYPEAIVFVYLNEEVQSLHPRIQDGKVFWNETENKYWSEIADYKNQILQSQAVDDWEAQPEQANCYFCDYKYHCADSGIGAENVTMSEIGIDTII